MTELVLVRHGEGECNAAGVIGGDRGCSGLSRSGRAQSTAVCRELMALHARRPFDVLLCSPRLRVRQSAEIVGARLGLPAVAVHGLRGQDFGAADGRAWDDVTAAFGGPPSHDPDRAIAPGAEPWNAYAARVLDTLAALLRQHAGRRILVIAHGKTVGLAGALLAGEPDPASAASRYVAGHGALRHWQVPSPDRLRTADRVTL
jgi:2,3-bisphosphoglycerate-dependent phosphoglycerate mutase